MQAIISAIEECTLKAEIAVCISNKENSGILDRARAHGIQAHYISAKGVGREEYDAKVI
jgi:folate-dependent phosphoribosylglycinamide formyltransferase PurN